MKVMDFRKNCWGHSLYLTSKTKNSLRVTGCSTPKPTVGDFLVIPDGKIVEVSELEKMGDPRDGFSATLKWLNLKCSDMPTVQQIQDAINNQPKE